MDTETQKRETLEQFGARIREKYPEYLKYSNVDIANRMIQKYPQYASKISDLPKEKDKSIFGKIGSGIANILTGETQKLGKTLGEIGASKVVTPAIEESQRLQSDVELKLIKQIREAKSAGRDTTRLEKALLDISGRQKTGEQLQQIVPGSLKSNRQVIGEIAGTATEALSGGIPSGVRGFGLAKVAPTAAEQAAKKAAFLAKPLSGRLKQIGAETLKDVATLAPFGYSFDVAQNLQEDKTGMEAFKPGVATIMSTILPIGIGTVRAGRQIAADTLSGLVAPNLSGVQSKAYERLRTGNVDLKNAPSTQQALDEARASASAFKQAMQKEFGEGQDKLIVEMTGKRITLPENEISKLTRIAERFGFEERLPQNMQSMSVKETMDLLKEINSVSIIKDIDDPLVKNLKLNLAEIKGNIMSKAGDTFTDKFSNLYSTYSKKAGLLKDIQDVVGKVGVKPNGIKLNPTQKQTATSRLQRIFNENGLEYLDTIKQLEKETGQNIVDRVAASQLAQKLPKTLRTAPVAMGGVLNDAIALLTLPLSSPRAASFIISQIGGYGRGTVTKLLNANPKLRKAVYDAVVDKNMKFSDAVELYMKDFIQNPKMGLSIEDVSKKSGSVQAYKGEKDLTTKILKDLEGKTTVSKQYILDATNRGELKQVERDLIRGMLETEGNTVNVADFAKKVKAELLPLKVKGSDTVNPKFDQYSSRYMQDEGSFSTKYDNIALPDDLRGKVANYKENIYESPIATSAGDVHFDYQTKNYFGHTRIEDMADNKTRRVIEVQSDLYQKGNLENKVPDKKKIEVKVGRPTLLIESKKDGLFSIKIKEKTYKDNFAGGIEFRGKKYYLDLPDLTLTEIKNELPEVYKKVGRELESDITKLQQYNDPTAHFRMVREEIKKASQDGKTKLQFPTGETIMKIEGLGEARTWNYGSPTGTQLRPHNMVVGDTVFQSGNSDAWIITDVLGDGKFKAVPKNSILSKEVEALQKGLKLPERSSDLRSINDLSETFDISGKVDTSNPIYKFYEKDLKKYLNKFGGKRVIDDKGVSWIEVPIKKEWAKMPVEAFALIPFGIISQKDETQ